jgi:predicted phosphodiesterase
LALIGLLSDSHGRAATTRSAVAILLDQGASLLLHLGDVGTVEVIDALVVDPTAAPQHEQSRLVFGNTDWDRDGLARYAAGLGVQVDHPLGRLPLDQGQGELIYLHGDDSVALEQALAWQPRYLCHGHTHRRADRRRGPTRIINPGALFRAEHYTAAVLDTWKDHLAFFTVGQR